MPHFIAHLPPHDAFSLPTAFQALQLLRFQTANRDRSLTLADMFRHYQIDQTDPIDLDQAAANFRTLSPVLRPEDREERDRQLKREVDDLDLQLSQLARERERLVEKGKVLLATLSAELTSNSLGEKRAKQKALRHELDLLDAMRADLIRRKAECEAGIGAKPLLSVEDFLDKLLTCLVIQRNAVLEGSPGLAKTSIVKTLAEMLGLQFNRIQFTPDLTAGEIAGSYQEERDEEGRAHRRWRPGPVFTNLLLGDELNRATPQAQNALIEMTEERQVTLGGSGASRLLRPLDPVNEARLVVEHRGYFGEQPADSANDRRVQCFITLCTMNALDSQGTYETGEAINDRFALKLRLNYPAHSVVSQLADHAFENEAAAPAKRTDPAGEKKSQQPLAHEPQTAENHEAEAAQTMVMAEESTSTADVNGEEQTAQQIRRPVRKTLRPDRPSSVVIDRSIVRLDEIEEVREEDIVSDLSQRIRQKFSPDIPLPFSPLPEPPRATYRDQQNDPGQALEIRNRERGDQDDEDKTAWYHTQREEQEHVRTLYFLLRLRKMILGTDMLKVWNSPSNTEMRDRVSLLVDLTHLRPYDWQERPGQATQPPSAKDDELKDLLDHWRDNPGNFPKHAHYAQLIQSLLEAPEYPVVKRGSSPRGLITLVRAIHAAALLRRGKAKPNWDDVAWIARDCLRHRIQIARDSDEPTINPDNLLKALIACLE